ncbi:allergen asp f7 protein [Rutstroemia sp. NJR-2017a BBW]|nr:allergen asp f7 protein [Rutstroemia sp. NJR-2017a BBW]
MKYSMAVLSSLMATAAVAQPHLRHQHAARHEKHEKRDVVWVTETKVVTQVVDFTTTVWVPAGATSAAASSVEAAASTLSKSVAAASSSVSEGGAFNESPSSSSVAAPSTSVAPTSSVEPTTSSTSVAPTTPSSSSVVVPTTTSSSSSVSVAPTTSSSSSSSVYVAPPSSTSSSTSADIQAAISISIPVVVPTVASSSSVAAAPTTRSVSSGVSAGASVSVCTSGAPCTGDITFYDAGLGACGWTTDGTTEAIIALPYELMGTQSNGNPYCGLYVTISYGGKTVVDKCMGCTGNSIDLSRAAWNQLASEDVGRTQAEWWFN